MQIVTQHACQVNKTAQTKIPE